MMHSNWMDNNLENSLRVMTNDEVKKAKEADRVYIAIGGIVAFFIMIILLSRYVKGEYR